VPQAGKDKLFADDNTKDVVDGGPGSDKADVDPIDIKQSIEALI
jgi:hypothetical protein